MNKHGPDGNEGYCRCGYYGGGREHRDLDDHLAALAATETDLPADDAHDPLVDLNYETESDLRRAARALVGRFDGNPMIHPSSEFAALVSSLRAALGDER